jgi:hypothetical protein
MYPDPLVVAFDGRVLTVEDAGLARVSPCWCTAAAGLAISNQLPCGKPAITDSG